MPAGACEVAIEAKSFREQKQQITISGKNSVLHFQLELAQLSQSVEVSASRLDTQVSTLQTQTSAKEIAQTPAPIRRTV